MSAARILTPEQREKVKIYHQTLAKIRGEKPMELDDDMLSLMVGTYNTIQLEGGGDPVKAAQKLT